MALYKFRVMYEEDDSIFRDIEIKPSNTLSDFEATIISAYNLPSNYNGVFFRSNDNWQRVKPMDAAVAKHDEKKVNNKAKAKAHSLPLIVTFIDDPHQKFVYEYKGSQEFAFLMELISLSGIEKSEIIYPLCVKQQGPSPFKKEDLMAHYGRKVSVEKEAEIVDEEEDDIEGMNLEGEEEVEEVEEAEEETETETEEAEPIDDVEEVPEEEEFIEEEELPEDGFGEQFGEEELE